MSTKMRILLLLFAILAFGTMVTLWVSFVDMTKEQYIKLIVGHFPAVVGLPMAAIAALVLVTYLQQRSGEGIKFKGLGFEFEGPSGQVVLWIVCFVVMAVTIKAVW